MKTLHWTVVLTVALSAAALFGANALKTGPSRAAVCDIRRVIVEYQKFIDLTASIKKAQEAATAELDRRHGEITRLSDQRKELKPGSPEDKAVDNQILEKGVEAQAFGELTRNRLERQQYQGVKDCYQDVLAAVDSYAKANAIDVVFSMRDVQMDEAKNSQDLESLIAARYVLYNDPGVDITNEVLKQLNAAYKPATQP